MPDEIEAGDWVLFVLDKGPNTDRLRPALVLEATDVGALDLQVFTKGQADNLPCPMYRPAVQPGQPHERGTWHQRARPEAAAALMTEDEAAADEDENEEAERRAEEASVEPAAPAAKPASKPRSKGKGSK